MSTSDSDDELDVIISESGDELDNGCNVLTQHNFI